MHIKNKELHERYTNYDTSGSPKPKRPTFRDRVELYWYTKEEAINPQTDIWRAKRNKHIKRDENGRVCNACNEYKPRDEFSFNKVWFHQRNSSCKECKNKLHAEYRKRNWYAKDHEYKQKKRKLNIWDQIYFNSEIWEVQSYKYNRWYTVKSIMSGTERRVDTWDNGIRVNRNCVKFRKVLEKVIIEKPKEEIKEEVIEEKKYNLSLDDLMNEWWDD